MCLLVAQLCLIFCKPMNYSSPGSSVHGILQARILDIDICICIAELRSVLSLQMDMEGEGQGDVT